MIISQPEKTQTKQQLGWSSHSKSYRPRGSWQHLLAT